MSKRLVGILTGMFVFAAVLLACLPIMVQIDARRVSERAVQELIDKVSVLDAAAIRKQRNLARWYNRNLSAEKPEADFQEAYDKLLSFGDGAMGWMEIPAKGLRLLIFHGTSPEILETGVGHLAESAFPIGGRGNHTVLVGEFGQMKPGELFYIHILGETLVYVVETVVEGTPNRVSVLDQADRCTLISPADGQGGVTLQGSRVDPVLEQAAIAALESRRFSDSGAMWTAAAAALTALMLPVFGLWISRGTAWVKGHPRRSAEAGITSREDKT